MSICIVLNIDDQCFSAKLQNPYIKLMILLKAGKVTNLVIVSRSSLLPTPNHRRVPNQYHVSQLEKYPQLVNSFKGTTTLLSLRPLYTGIQTDIDMESIGLLKQKISSSQVFPSFPK